MSKASCISVIFANSTDSTDLCETEIAENIILELMDTNDKIPVVIAKYMLQNLDEYKSLYLHLFTYANDKYYQVCKTIGYDETEYNQEAEKASDEYVNEQVINKMSAWSAEQLATLIENCQHLSIHVKEIKKFA